MNNKTDNLSTSFFDIDDVVDSNIYEVWRYVMDGHTDFDGALNINAFEITEKDDGFLSFFHSKREKLEDRVKNVHRLVPLSKTKPAIYFKLDAEETIQAEDGLYFFDANYPHIGMSYTDTTQLNSMEIRTSLIELATIYKRKEGGTVEPVF